MAILRSSPNNATSLFDGVFYFFQRPQEMYGPNAPIPPPITPSDFEVAEQVATVFDDVVYNETGSGNDGQLVVTQI
jgi:hypothetical protein